MAQNDTLTARQRKAIAALLASPTVSSAAETAGVSRSQLERWRRQPAFRAALAQAEADIIEEAARQLLKLQGTAIRVIARVMLDDNSHAGVRIRAAQLIVENTLRLREIVSLEERIAALEAEHESEPDTPVDGD